jgi:hypothetical protein
MMRCWRKCFCLLLSRFNGTAQTRLYPQIAPQSAARFSGVVSPVGIIAAVVPPPIEAATVCDMRGIRNTISLDSRRRRAQGPLERAFRNLGENWGQDKPRDFMRWKRYLPPPPSSDKSETSC